MEAVLRDIRFGLRMLIKHPGFSIAAIIALSLGIGANTAIFSMVNAILLRPLPYSEPERLVGIWAAGIGSDLSSFSIPEFIDYRDQNRSLDQLLAYHDYNVNITDRGDPERIQGVRMTANAFQMLGVTALIGRTLVPEDDIPGARVVVLAHGLWQRRFGGDPNVLGQSLTLNAENYTVVGVLSPSFIFPAARAEHAELALPLAPDGDPRRTERRNGFLRLVGRLNPGVGVEQARADLTGVARRMLDQYPESGGRATSVEVLELRDDIVGGHKTSLMMLLFAVGSVLLIGCINLANLLLARSSARQREIAIRMALGASRTCLIRQLLTESSLLAALGGALGLVLTLWSVNAIPAISPATLPRARHIDIDGRVMLFTLGVSALAAIIFGLVPAMQSSKIALDEELKGGGRGSSGNLQQSRLRGVLVVLEIAGCLVLLISAGLLIKSFAQLQAVRPGFDGRGVLVARLALPKEKYSQSIAVKNFYDQLSPRIMRLPGVESVGAISILPLSGPRANVDFTVMGRPPAAREETPICQYRMISPGYFQTMRIPLLAGRDIAENDTRQSSPVAIISETLMKQFFPDQNPVGAHIILDDGELQPRQVEIVGVVGDVKLYKLDAEPTADVYVPIPQVPEESIVYLTNNMFFTVRTAADPMTLAGPVRREVQMADKDVPASNIRPMSEYLESSLAAHRFNLLLLEIFAVSALVLAVTGLYFVVSYSVISRRREMGIRMALGARPGDVVRLVMSQGLRLILIGISIGLAGAVLATGLISGLLYGVSATDLFTYGFTALLLMLIGLVASYFPALRATRVDPMITLRTE